MASKVFVEIEVNSDCHSDDDEISEIVKKFLKNKTLRADMEFYEDNFRSFPMRANIRKILIATNADTTFVNAFKLNDYGENVEYFVYRLNYEDYQHAEITDDGEMTAIVASTCFSLPHYTYNKLWENLIYDSNVKNDMLSYCETMVLFSLRNVDISVITSNRLALFHGPPGSGKTSLCKALAQKLSIRLSKYYTKFQLLEINSHSLFSKYYSESAKIVMKLFDLLRVILSDSNTLAIVLIDEIESLVKNRISTVASAEPGDSLRVVNAILTQMDSIKTFPNVLVLTTSNMADQVDPAFIDRVDFKKFIDTPSESIVYRILRSCIIELQEKGLVGPGNVDPSTSTADSCVISSKLLRVATNCDGVSGRSLRKLPIIAYALLKIAKGSIAKLESFIDSLSDAIQQILDGSKVSESVSILVQNEPDVKAELRDSECQTDPMQDDPNVNKTVSTSAQSEPEFKPEFRDIGFQTEANEVLVVHAKNEVEEVTQLPDCFGKQK